MTKTGWTKHSRGAYLPFASVARRSRLSHPDKVDGKSSESRRRHRSRRCGMIYLVDRRRIEASEVNGRAELLVEVVKYL